MQSKKKRINVKHPERSLLTDTTPYELPVFFTNANFAVLAYHNKRHPEDYPLHAKYLLAKKASQPTKPFHFKIRKDAAGLRRLDLAHPRSQHLMSQFYEEYELFICNACDRSDYSLRRPSRIATRYVDPKYSSNASNSIPQADEDPVGFRDQSKWASTYFSYRDYNLSYKFFESDEFLSLERRYSLMMKLDVSRCFDSIYTHSIEWSMRGKDFAKQHLPNSERTTFESKFDLIIRHANWNETHGIIIGPEFSRIFAEVVMQSADRSIKERTLTRGNNVVIRRYVDDFFVFANEAASLDQAKHDISAALEELNLHLNDAKTKTIPRPFTSKLSAARSRIADALDEFFKKAAPLFGHDGTLPDSRQIERARSAAITNLRRTAIEFDVPYSQFSSFSLAIIDRQLAASAEAVTTLKPDLATGHLPRLSWILAVVRIAQFLYAIDQRVTTSVKLAKIYTSALDLAGAIRCARAPIEGQIIDGLRYAGAVRQEDASDEISRINHVCSVDLLMTGDRKLDVSDLRQQVGYSDESGALEKRSFLELLCYLFISRKRHRFQDVRERTTAEIERRISQSNVRFDVDTEASLLLTDYMSCPHIDSSRKERTVAAVYKKITGANCPNKLAKEILNSSSWISFTDWSGTSDLKSMLARKELTPAYE